MNTYLVAGLGNKDREYAGTRHNIGFHIVDTLASELGVEFEESKKIDSQLAEAKLNGRRLIIIKPNTYVNKSGEAVGKALKFYKIAPARLTVVHDDLDISVGSYKASFDRNSAGHKGVESVIRYLKTKKFQRLRIGIASPALKKARSHRSPDKKRNAVADFVLSRFTPSERSKVETIMPDILRKLQDL